MTFRFDMSEERQGFEAKHYAMRKSRDGTVISFVVHPDDMTPELNALPIGARVMIGWAQIGDDEKPIPVLNHGPDGTQKPKRKFHELPLAQQCAMRCQDAAFLEFLDDRAGLTEMHDPAHYVRQLLGINSRSELGKGNHDADNAWRALNSEFERWDTDRKYADARR